MIIPPASSGYIPPLAPLPLPGAFLSSSSSISGSGTASSQSVGPIQSAPLLNGASGYFLQMPNQPRSVISLFFPATHFVPGTEKLLLQMLEDGSESTKQMLSQLNNQGIHFSTDRRDDHIKVSISAPTGQEGIAAQVLLRLLTQPIVDQASFNTLKSNAIKRLQGLLSDPDDLLLTAMQQRIYGPNHTFSLSTRDCMKNVSQQTIPALMASYQQMLQSVSRAKVLMISSQPVALQQQALNDAIRSTGWFGQPYGMSANNASNALPNPGGTQAPVLHANNTLKRAMIKTTWKAPDVRDPDYAAFCLLRSFLQGNSHGSFFQKMRTEDGLVYGVDMLEGYKLAQGNCFHLGFEVDFNKLGLALNDVQAVTRNVCQTSINPAALDTLKRKWLLDYRMRLQEPMGVASLYAPWLTLDTQLPDFKQMQDAINRVTSGDIQRVANRVFNPQTGAFQLIGVSAPVPVLQQWFPGLPVSA